MTMIYDVVIIGAGVTGMADLFTLARYTNVERILVIERRGGIALVNSNTTFNSQTLHYGDIESNYPLEMALRVRRGAMLVNGFVDNFEPDVGMRLPKMLLGVGDKEVEIVARRFGEFARAFPELELLARDEIAGHEPKIVEGRKEKQQINALYNPHGLAVDYHQLATSMHRHAVATGKHIDTIFGTGVESIERSRHGFVIRAGGTAHTARAVLVGAGSVSLLFAQALGYGREYALLPVAGSFYKARKLLSSKVYTVQNPKLPFAAIHGDPATYDPDETRFGPTARPMPLLERHYYRTFFEFMRTGTMKPAGLWALVRIILDWDISRFAFKNIMYDVPWLGKRIFLRGAKKIIPSIRVKDITLDKGAGGIRGQLVDLRTKKIAKGADKIVGDGIIFTMAPSPGASYCLGNAEEDALHLREFLGDGYHFDRERFRKELTAELDRNVA